MANFMQGDGDNGISVPFSDDEVVRDEELIADEDKPGESPEERKTRRQRRQERLQLKLQAGKKAEEELERERAEKAELRERLARLEGVVVAQQQRPVPQNDTGKDPFEAELDAIYAEQQSAYQAAQAEVKAGTYDADRAKHYDRVARDIEARKARVHTRRELAQTEPVRQQNQAQQVWVQKYPEVYGNQRAFAYAQGRYQTRAALGEAITNEVVDEIMQEAKAQFKLGPKPAPTVSERARFSGQPSSGASGGGKPEAVTLTPALKRMAVAAYDHLPEEEAIKKWTQKTGKRMREQKLL